MFREFTGFMRGELELLKTFFQEVRFKASRGEDLENCFRVTGFRSGLGP